MYRLLVTKWIQKLLSSIGDFLPLSLCWMDGIGIGDTKEISPGCLLEGLMLKLKLQYCGYLMRRVDSLEKTLMLGGIGGRRRRGRQRMRWLDGITDSMEWVWVNSGSWWWTGRPGVLRFVGSQRVGHDWATELNWTELKRWYIMVLVIREYFIFNHCIKRETTGYHVKCSPWSAVSAKGL